jgi:inner membrane protein
MDPKNFRNSITVRLIIIGVLILILLIPSALITGIVSEREQQKREAISEITSKWAKEQTIGWPRDNCTL